MHTNLTLLVCCGRSHDFLVCHGQFCLSKHLPDSIFIKRLECSMLTCILISKVNIIFVVEAEAKHI